MSDQTINPVLPVSKIRNTLRNKKRMAEKKSPAKDKSVADQSNKKKGRVDTYA